MKHPLVQAPLLYKFIYNAIDSYSPLTDDVAFIVSFLPVCQQFDFRKGLKWMKHPLVQAPLLYKFIYNTIDSYSPLTDDVAFIVSFLPVCQQFDFAMDIEDKIFIE